MKRGVLLGLPSQIKCMSLWALFDIVLKSSSETEMDSVAN